MASKVDIDNLASEIVRGLEEYTQEVADEVNAATKQIAKEAKKIIQQNAPVRASRGKGTKPGAYKRSWTVKTENGRYEAVNIVHARQYQLTHLLENGHALRQGGRARAIPHIAQGEEYAIENLPKEIERRLGGGS